MKKLRDSVLSNDNTLFDVAIIDENESQDKYGEEPENAHFTRNPLCKI